MANARHHTTSALGTQAVLIAAAIVTLIPVAWVLLSSLKSNREIRAGALTLPSTLSLQNYVDVWTAGGFARSMANSLIVSLLAALLVVGTASLAAYAFARYRFRGNGLLFYLIFLGMTFPVSARVGPLLSVMYGLRLVDTHAGLILAYAANSMPFAVLMMRAFFRQFPRELEEAARIDGASGLQILLRILLPVSTPALFALGIFTFIAAWNEFLIAFLLITEDTLRTLPLALLRFQGEYVTDYARSITAVCIAAVPVLVLYLVFQRQFIAGITAGSLK